MRYKPNFKSKAKGYYKFFIGSFLLSFLITDYNPLLFSIGAVLFGYFYFNALSKSVIEIFIDVSNNFIYFKYKQFQFYITTEKYEINKYEFVFKEQIREGGIKSHSFRVLKDEIKIVDIFPELTGWSKDILKEIAVSVKKLKNKR